MLSLSPLREVQKSNHNDNDDAVHFISSYGAFRSFCHPQVAKKKEKKKKIKSVTNAIKQEVLQSGQPVIKVLLCVLRAFQGTLEREAHLDQMASQYVTHSATHPPNHITNPQAESGGFTPTHTHPWCFRSAGG